MHKSIIVFVNLMFLLISSLYFDTVLAQDTVISHHGYKTEKAYKPHETRKKTYRPHEKQITDYFKDGRVPKSSELAEHAEKQGWKKTKTENGPITYVDNNGVKRLKIKSGSQRTPGSEFPHVEMRNENNQLIDKFGNKTTKETAENHTPIEHDLKN